MLTKEDIRTKDDRTEQNAAGYSSYCQDSPAIVGFNTGQWLEWVVFFLNIARSHRFYLRKPFCLCLFSVLGRVINVPLLIIRRFLFGPEAGADLFCVHREV